MSRMLTLATTAVVAAALALPAWAEKIDGYEVVTKDSGLTEVTDLESGLGDLIDLGPLELGAAEEDHIVLNLYFQLLDSVPITGKVHKIRFENLSLNEVSFTIPEIEAFEIPSSPPYEIEDPLTIKAAYGDIAVSMLREMLSPNYTFLVSGKVLVFGKFKINNRKKKYVVPVDINVELSSDSLAQSEYRDAVADQIFEILKSDLLENLEKWRDKIGDEPEGEAAPQE